MEARHVDLANQRWVFQKSEAKMKRITRVVYLTDRALEITRRSMLAHPEGPLFRNSNGKPWTTEAVNCGFTALQARMGKLEMERHGLEISDDEIKARMATLKPTRHSKGVEVSKTDAELRCEAKRKLTIQAAAKLARALALRPAALVGHARARRGSIR